LLQFSNYNIMLERPVSEVQRYEQTRLPA
jgi:hypothetical protein